MLAEGAHGAVTSSSRRAADAPGLAGRPTRRDDCAVARPALLARFPRVTNDAFVSAPIIEPDGQAAFPEFAEQFAVLDEEIAPRFAAHDLAAQNAQNRYYLEQIALLVGAVAATIAGVLQASLPGEHWPGIVVSVVAALLAWFTARSRAGRSQKLWMDARLRAELLRREYFLYLGQQGRYADDGDRRLRLGRRVREIELAEQGT